LEQVIELATGLGINDNPDDRLEEDDLTIDQKDRVRRSMEELVKNIPARKDLDIAVHPEPASLTPFASGCSAHHPSVDPGAHCRTVWLTRSLARLQTLGP